MEVQTSSEDVFRYLKAKYAVDDEGDINAIALFAYALVEQDRIDWRDHMVAQYKVPPTDQQTVDWFRAKPRSYFDDRERDASDWYRQFARGLLRDEIEMLKAEAVEQACGRLGRFWPNFWVGNLVGLTSNVAFTVLVIIFVIAITNDFSFVAWMKALLSAHTAGPK
jgi:hypothetical protein